MAYRQCTAKAKSTGQQCQQPAVPGRNVCRFHGGRSLRGTAHPNYKHGRNVRGALPEKLRERFDASQADPNLLALRQDISIIDAMLEERLSTLEDGGSFELWPKARKALNAFRYAMAGQDTAGMRQAMTELTEIIEHGASEGAARAEVLRLIQDRRRLVESEQKRLVAMQQMVTSEQLVALIDRIARVIGQHVEDAKARVRIADELDELLQIDEG